MTKAVTELKDVYQRITDRIIESLEKGVRPWERPWTVTDADGGTGFGAGGLPLRSNGQPYRGINIVMLWITAAEAGYRSRFWFTFKQAKDLGGNIRKGEKGTFICFASTFSKEQTNDAGETSTQNIPFMKGYTVFNADQCDGLPAKFYAAIEPVAAEEQEIRTIAAIEQSEVFFANTKAQFQTGGDRAFYSPSLDFIKLPTINAFRDAESYAATKAHELIHWTGHTSRLDRKFSGAFGDAQYAAEELVAELGSAFLCSDLSITPEVRDDHAEYLATWLRVLKNDKRAIFKATSLAQKAVDCLKDLQPGSASEAVQDEGSEWQQAA